MTAISACEGQACALGDNGRWRSVTWVRSVAARAVRGARSAGAGL